MPEDDSNLVLWLAIKALAEQAVRDPLTGLHNRRYFDDTLADHIAAAQRYDRDLALVLFDLDEFKRVNDEHGHEAGDAILKTFANELRSTARRADICCRIGGDEFAVILPETNRTGAERYLARLATIESLPLYSFGIAEDPNKNMFAVADADLLTKKAARRPRPNPAPAGPDAPASGQ